MARPSFSRLLRARLSLGFAAAVLVATPLIAGAQANQGELGIQDLDTSEYPAVSFKVTVPPVLASAGDELEFEVAENGRDVEDVAVGRLKGEETPAHAILVIDTSGSMEGQPLADAKQAAAGFIEAIGPGASVAVVAFADTPTLAQGFTADRQALIEAIDGLVAGGETALYDAMLVSAGLLPEAVGGQRAVVILSDGGDTVSASSFESAAESVVLASVPVYAVALQSDEYNPQALETLAKSSSGRLIAVAESAQLAAQFESIAEEIRDAYVISYSSARPRTKDIEISVAASAGDASAASAIAYPNPELSWMPTADSALTLDPTGPGRVEFLAGAAILAFVSVALLAGSAVAILWRERSSIDQLDYYDQLHASTEVAGTGGMSDQMRAKVVSAVDQVAGKRGFTQVIGDKLEKAGLPLRPAEYITFHLIFVIVIGVFTQLLLGGLFFSFMVVVAASAGPIMALNVAVGRRRRAFDEQLADVLSMIAGSLRGGWGLLQAVEFVVQEAGEPAASEFRRVQIEARLGMPLDQALHKMSIRLESSDFDTAVNAISIQREVGGNLAEVLDVVAKTVRERAALKRQVGALTAEGRLSAGILLALPFLEAAFLMLISPTYIQPLFSTAAGLTMVFGALVLMVIGAVWLRSATKIEV